MIQYKLHRKIGSGYLQSNVHFRKTRADLTWVLFNIVMEMNARQQADILDQEYLPITDVDTKVDQG